MSEKDAAGEAKRKRGTPRPVVCWESGEAFPSVSAAAKALGRSDPTNLIAAIKKHSTFAGYHWYYEDQPKPAVELLGKGRKRAVVCYESGEEFESVAAAAQAVGASSSNISASLRTGGKAGGYHWYRKGDPKPSPNAFKGNKPVVCWETGREFNSAQEAASWAGTTVDRLNGALNARTPEGGYHWYLAGTPKPKLEELGYCRPVVCLETGRVFSSVKKAAEFAGLKDDASIRRAMGVRKDGRRKTAGGYHWTYADNLEPDGPQLKASAAQTPRAVACWETGEVFPSAKEAARSAGVRKTDRITTAIARRATAGGYHWYWADEPKPAASELTNPSNLALRPVVCWETGEVFPSTADAAEAVGLKNKFAISGAIKNSRMAGGYHWYWEDEPRPTAFEQKKGKKRPVVCWETGEVYESSVKAAAAMGLKNPYSISRAIKKKGLAGGYHWYYEDEPRPDASELATPSPAALQPHPPSKKSRPVVCWETGEVYERAHDAAAAVGLSAPMHIYRAISNRDMAGGYHWYYWDEPRPSAGELKYPAKPQARAVICWETGEVYESAAAVAKAMGLKNMHCVNNAINKGTACAGYHWYRQGDPKPDASQLKNLEAWKCGGPVVCVESNVEYSNTAAAAEAMGLKDQGSISRAIRTGDMSGGYHWRYRSLEKER